MVGQDESTFHQFIFSKKQWKGPNGKEFLMRRSEGDIYMASRYTAREVGLGLGTLLTPHVSHKICTGYCYCTLVGNEVEVGPLSWLFVRLV
jgi:hypothetical protein